MTSYRHPDYDVDLNISVAIFNAIAGLAHDVTVSFGENENQVSGMLIVPQRSSISESSPSADAWLWLEDRHIIPVETLVRIILGEPCDPMLSQEDNAQLASNKGLCLNGLVRVNWNADID